MKYSDPYMEWRPLAVHAPDCKRTGWDVRTYELGSYGGSREIGVRAICSEVGGCGIVAELSFELAADCNPDTGDPKSGMTFEGGGVDRIGYGTKPQRIGDVWLHAGPPFVERNDDGPGWWYVTRSAVPPAEYSDTLGQVFRVRKGGRQLKGRFSAGVGWCEGKYGVSFRARREDLTSRTAAARWLEQKAAELDATDAAGEGK